MRLFLLTLLISSKAFALDVIASGEGKNFEEALLNAKVVALDKVNGAWVHGDSFVRDGMFTEKITQYNGGVIRKYDVIQSTATTVTIKADVVPRSNEMTSNTMNVTPDMKQELKSRIDNQAALEKAKRIVDDRSRALSFSPTKIRYINKGDTTTVIIDGVVSFQKKWLEDFKALVEMSNSDFNLHSFYQPQAVDVMGMDGHKQVTPTFHLSYSDMGLYAITPYGVRINRDAKEPTTLTFSVNSADLFKVDQFVVKFK